MTTAATRNGTRTPAEPPARSLGDWFRALWRERYEYLERHYQSKAAMSGLAGVTGGYLVPIEFVKDVLAVAQESSIMLRLGRRVPMSTADVTIPHVSVTSGAAGVTPFFGGAVFTWGPQGVTLAETEPTFTSTALRAYALQGYAVVSNQLLADGEGGELSAYLTTLLGEAAGWYFDYACFQGTGTAGGMPLGVLNGAGVAEVTRTAVSDVQAADLAKMAEKLIPSGWGPPFNACWALHPSVLAKLFALGVWQINQPPAEDGTFHVLGLPAYVTEKVPALGTRGDVSLFIPQLYLVGLRAEVEVSISRDEPGLFLKGQSAVRVVLRGDGQPRIQAAPPTLADGTKSASAYVVLK